MKRTETGQISRGILKKMEPYPAFHKKVWRACATIPKGQVRTYQWIAQKIGHPKAARAVANSLAVNPFAPKIPCHRVVRADGNLGGYSGAGGIATKRRLLRREGALEN